MPRRIVIDNSTYYKPCQKRIFQSKKRFVFPFTGRRGGKTYDGERCCLSVAYSSAHTIKPVWWLEPTIGQAKLILEEFYRRFQKVIVDIYYADRYVILFNGRRIYFHGADHADNLRCAGLYAAFLDEISFMKANVWHSVIRPMLSDIGGRAWLIGSPSPEGPAHWSSELWELMKTDPDWDCLEFTTEEMGVIPLAEIEAARRTLPEDIFATEYLAKRISREGQVYREFGAWNLVDSIPDSFYKAGAIAGLDLGYEHPSVFVVVYHNYEKSAFYVAEAFYHKHGNEESHVQIARELRQKHGISQFFCDHNRPDFVERFVRDGLPAILADKDVMRGVDDVRKVLLKPDGGQPKLYFLRDKCRALLDEIPKYRYKPGTNQPNKAAGQDDGLDALRYAIVSLFQKGREMIVTYD